MGGGAEPVCLCPASLLPQDTQEFLRCLMDQLHEELKEPECGAESVREERRDGDRSPSEDEFLSCDSGASSDRGEGGEGILIQDESGGIRGGISEKERLKERRVSGSPRRGGSQEMDEDADIDTAAEEGGATRAGDSEDPPPNSVSKQNHRAGTGAQADCNKSAPKVLNGWF